MQEQLKIAGAFVGVIVGAGFASGRELLLFFVDFGVWGLAGALVSAALFTLVRSSRKSSRVASLGLVLVAASVTRRLVSRPTHDPRRSRAGLYRVERVRRV